MLSLEREVGTTLLATDLGSLPSTRHRALDILLARQVSPLPVFPVATLPPREKTPAR